MLNTAQIFQLFRDTEALLDGHFQLTSGLHSLQYFQCAKVLQYPPHAEALCRVAPQNFSQQKIAAVIAPAVGGIIVAHEVGRLMQTRVLFAERQDGKMSLRRGFQLAAGEKVLVCEDVVTTGGSVQEVIQVVREAGGEVAGVFCIVDRSNGKANFGVPLVSTLQLAPATFPPRPMSALCRGKSNGKARKPVHQKMIKRNLLIRVPASTSNLGSGFDALGLAIDLLLAVSFSIEKSGRQIHATGEGAAVIATEKNNLLLAAFDRACQKMGCTPPPLQIKMHNPIPLKRGLGSSGAAIVAGLAGANALLGKKLSQQQLLDLANELEGHPENTSASLLGGLTVNGAENGQVRLHRFLPPEEWTAAAFIPTLEITTHDARRVLPETLPRHEAVNNVQRVAVLVAAFAKRDAALLRFGVQDWLHQPYRKVLIPGFDDILAAAYHAGAFAAFLSGSGSTLLAICAKSKAKKISSAMARAAAQHHLTGKAAVLKFARRGVEILKH